MTIFICVTVFIPDFFFNLKLTMALGSLFIVSLMDRHIKKENKHVISDSKTTIQTHDSNPLTKSKESTTSNMANITLQNIHHISEVHSNSSHGHVGTTHVLGITETRSSGTKDKGSGNRNKPTTSAIGEGSSATKDIADTMEATTDNSDKRTTSTMRTGSSGSKYNGETMETASPNRGMSTIPIMEAESGGTKDTGETMETTSGNRKMPTMHTMGADSSGNKDTGETMETTSGNREMTTIHTMGAVSSGTMDAGSGNRNMSTTPGIGAESSGTNDTRETMETISGNRDTRTIPTMGAGSSGTKDTGETVETTSGNRDIPTTPTMGVGTSFTKEYLEATFADTIMTTTRLITASSSRDMTTSNNEGNAGNMELTESTYAQGTDMTVTKDTDIPRWYDPCKEDDSENVILDTHKHNEVQIELTTDEKIQIVLDRINRTIRMFNDAKKDLENVINSYVSKMLFTLNIVFSSL